MTEGTSLVNNTINYTTQPSQYADGTRIPNATLSLPLSDSFNTNLQIFHEHRFDCDRAGGAKFYLDGKLMQVDAHNIPKFGGSIQLKLWADGNKWWSGNPSSTTVTMSVKSIIAYFNTSGTEDGSDTDWFHACSQAGGPSNDTICEAYAEVGKLDNLPIASNGVSASRATELQTMAPTGTNYPQSPVTDNDLRDGECWSRSKHDVVGVQPCKSQATRSSPPRFDVLRKIFERGPSRERSDSAINNGEVSARRNTNNESCCYTCYSLGPKPRSYVCCFPCQTISSQAIRNTNAIADVYQTMKTVSLRLRDICKEKFSNTRAVSAEEPAPSTTTLGFLDPLDHDRLSTSQAARNQPLLRISNVWA